MYNISTVPWTISSAGTECVARKEHSTKTQWVTVSGLPKGLCPPYQLARQVNELLQHYDCSPFSSEALPSKDGKVSVRVELSLKDCRHIIRYLSRHLSVSPTGEDSAMTVTYTADKVGTLSFQITQ